MTLAPEQIDSRPPEAWGELLAFLSMDLTAPLWTQLGHVPDDPIAERDDLRTMIRALRERAARDTAALPDIRRVVFRENIMGWDPDRLQGLGQLGLRFVADHSEAPDLSGWEIALAHYPDRFPETASRLQETGETTAMDAILEEYGPDPTPVDLPAELSEWDLQLCARHGWNPDSDMGFPPVDVPMIAITIHATGRILQAVADRLSPEIQHMLLVEARRCLDELGVWMPAPLGPLHLEVPDVSDH